MSSTTLTQWLVTHQQGGLPVSVSRADGVHASPPSDLADYLERAFGPWTLDPATSPLGVQGIEWPKLCDPSGWTGCPGTMSYVDRVPIQMATGEEAMTPGWRCDLCGQLDTEGFSVRTKTVVSHRPG